MNRNAFDEKRMLFFILLCIFTVILWFFDHHPPLLSWCNRDRREGLGIHVGSSCLLNCNVTTKAAANFEDHIEMRRMKHGISGTVWYAAWTFARDNARHGKCPGIMLWCKSDCHKGLGTPSWCKINRWEGPGIHRPLRCKSDCQEGPGTPLWCNRNRREGLWDASGRSAACWTATCHLQRPP